MMREASRGLKISSSEPKNYQCSTEGQKFNENLAPVLVIISRNSLVFSRKITTSILVFTGTAPPTRQQQ